MAVNRLLPALELERVEDEVADDLVLPLEQEGDSRGHEVPDEDLVVVERTGVVGVAGGDGAHGAAAVVHHRLPEEAPRLLLHVARRAPPVAWRRVVGLGGGAAVQAPPFANVAAGSLRPRVAAGMQRAGGARRVPPPPPDPGLPRIGSDSEGTSGSRGRRGGASGVQRQQGSHCRDRHARAKGERCCWDGIGCG